MNKELETLLATMTPEIYQQLVAAVETGKWPGGIALSAEQRAHSLQLMMLWQSRHNPQPEHMSIGPDGELVTKSKQELKEAFNVTDEIARFPL